jgi:hypothetical protein
MVGDAEWMFEYEGSLSLQVFHKQRLRIVDLLHPRPTKESYQPWSQQEVAGSK